MWLILVPFKNVYLKLSLWRLVAWLRHTSFLKYRESKDPHSARGLCITPIMALIILAVPPRSVCLLGNPAIRLINLSLPSLLMSSCASPWDAYSVLQPAPLCCLWVHWGHWDSHVLGSTHENIMDSRQFLILQTRRPITIFVYVVG